MKVYSTHRHCAKQSSSLWSWTTVLRDIIFGSILQTGIRTREMWSHLPKDPWSRNSGADSLISVSVSYHYTVFPLMSGGWRMAPMTLAEPGYPKTAWWGRGRTARAHWLLSGIWGRRGLLGAQDGVRRGVFSDETGLWVGKVSSCLKMGSVVNSLKIEMPLDILWRYKVQSMMFWGEVRTKRQTFGNHWHINMCVI